MHNDIKPLIGPSSLHDTVPDIVDTETDNVESVPDIVELTVVEVLVDFRKRAAGHWYCARSSLKGSKDHIMHNITHDT